jgi:glutaconyl-CoA/methylmalonyl-CoA decarboxylase subunit gamma
MKYFVTLPSGRELVVDIAEDASGKQLVSVDGTRVEADAVSYGGGHAPRVGRGATSVRVDSQVVELWLEKDPPDVGVIANGRRFFAKVESERMRIRAAARPGRGSEGGIVKSPMPGRVLRVLVAEGDEVLEGAAVVVVEAMKMENELGATRAGKITKIFVAAGATVEGGANLLEIG